MKIAVVSHSCVVAINRKIYFELAKFRDIELTLFAPSYWKSDIRMKIERADESEGEKGRIIYINPYFAGNGSLYFYEYRFKKELRAIKPDIIFIDEEPWSLSALQTVYFSSIFKPLILFYTKQNIYKRYPFPFNQTQKYIFHSAVKGVAVSRECETILRRHGFNKNINLLPHAVDTANFCRKESNKLRGQMGLKGFIFGYIGRLTREKGLLTLLEASYILKNRQVSPSPLPIAMLRSNGSPSSPQRGEGWGEEGFKILIVGDGYLKNEMNMFISKRGLEDIVIIHPSVPHNSVSEYLNCIDTFILPSMTTTRWKEQFGRVIIESLSCGVPVIGSDSGAIPELISDTGGGIIFPQGNAEVLSEKMSQIMNNHDLRFQVIEKGERSVRERYSIKAVAQQLYQILA